MKLSFLKKAILGGLIVVAIVAGSLVAIFPVSASTETMSITPSTQSVANSATSISVSIVCDTTAATRGWGAEVDFNPAQLPGNKCYLRKHLLYFDLWNCLQQSIYRQ